MSPISDYFPEIIDTDPATTGPASPATSGTAPQMIPTQQSMRVRVCAKHVSGTTLENSIMVAFSPFLFNPKFCNAEYVSWTDEQTGCPLPTTARSELTPGPGAFCAGSAAPAAETTAP